MPVGSLRKWFRVVVVPTAPAGVRKEWLRIVVVPTVALLTIMAILAGGFVYCVSMFYIPYQMLQKEQDYNRREIELMEQVRSQQKLGVDLEHQVEELKRREGFFKDTKDKLEVQLKEFQSQSTAKKRPEAASSAASVAHMVRTMQDYLRSPDANEQVKPTCRDDCWNEYEKCTRTLSDGVSAVDNVETCRQKRDACVLRRCIQ